MKKVVVFGGAGFVGSHVADLMSKNGYEVHIFDKTSSPYLNDSQHMITGDILDREKVDYAIKDAMYVYHFAGIADINDSSMNPWTTMNVNVMGTCNILEACRKYQADRILFASTIYVYSEMGSFYRVSKQACEKLIEEYAKEYHQKYTIIRFGSLYGPRANLFNSIRSIIKQALKEGKIVRPGSGEEIREYIHVLDAAQECITILDPKFEDKHVIITGNQSLKIKELLHMIKEILQNSIEIEYMPEEKNFHHYEITPYCYKPQTALRLIPQPFHDLGQGLLEEVHNVEEEINKNAF